MFESEFWAMLGRHHHQHHHLQQQEQQAPAGLVSAPALPAAATASWSRLEDKVFETALVSFPEGSPDRWFQIASQLPGKEPREVLDHYRALLQDIHDIDSGRIPLPEYGDADDDEEEEEEESASGDSGARRQISFGGKGKEERKKGVPWTEEEHRRFLEGLEKYGKGDWRSISRNAVVTRTPTQVASHAQKYFIRLNSMGKKEKKRGSIHDITKP